MFSSTAGRQFGCERHTGGGGLHTLSLYPEQQLTVAVCLHAMASSVKALMVHGNNLDLCCLYDTVHRARVYSDSSDGSSGITPVWGSEEEQVCIVGAD